MQESTPTPEKVKVTFKTDTGLIAEATLVNGLCTGYKMKTKVPRRFYYSCLNEVGLTAESLWQFAE